MAGTSRFQRSVEAAIEDGVAFLLAQQDRDGFWREFDLQPGASESWVTAWVGWCLARAAAGVRGRGAGVHAACRRAVTAICRARRDGGWGYHRGGGPDADSSAWALRFLAACGVGVIPAAVLGPYIDPGGGVHTFRERGYGAWTDAHDDVAANAGLALLAGPTGGPLASRVLDRLAVRFPVRTFWWSTQTYGVAWTLRALCAGGRLSDALCAAARDWIADLPEADSAFELAHRLVALRGLERSAAARDAQAAQEAIVSELLDRAGPEGWAVSSHLLVPPREGAEPSPPHPELRGLLTTSMSVCALAEWRYPDRG